jgi:hypothetical protein
MVRRKSEATTTVHPASSSPPDSALVKRVPDVRSLRYLERANWRDPSTSAYASRGF